MLELLMALYNIVIDLDYAIYLFIYIIQVCICSKMISASVMLFNLLE